MKYLSQASGYRMVHLCLFPNPSIHKKGELSFFSKWEVQKSVFTYYVDI